MADCDAQTLVTESICLVQGMSPRQLLAAILCELATQYDMACDAQTMVNNSRCLWDAMSERQLLAAIVMTLCEGGGGGGGSEFTVGTGSPEGVVTGSPGDRFWDTDTGFEYTKVTGSATNTGWQVH